MFFFTLNGSLSVTKLFHFILCLRVINNNIVIKSHFIHSNMFSIIYFSLYSVSNLKLLVIFLCLSVLLISICIFFGRAPSFWKNFVLIKTDISALQSTEQPTGFHFLTTNSLVTSSKLRICILRKILWGNNKNLLNNNLCFIRATKS